MDSTAKNSKVKKYVALFALILAGSTIYELPYLSYNYYDVILEAMNISNSQLGLLMSIFGFISMIGYFPGGYLASHWWEQALLDCYCQRIRLTLCLFLFMLCTVFFHH